MAFPGATASREDAAYAVVGAPLDVSASFRPGARAGPRRVRRFAEAFEDFDHRTGRRFTDQGVHDAGDLAAWTDVPDYLGHLEGVIGDLGADGLVPLLLGGEHTVAVAGVRATEPVHFVCLDAHLDLRSSFDGDEWSHACTTRRALETADSAVLLGARSGSEAGWERASQSDVTVVPPAEVAGWAPPPDGSVYLSVDIDVADPGFAPGTGTLEPFGLAPRPLRRVVRELAPRCVGIDVVEVTDRDDGQTAALAAKLLREFVFAHAETG